MITLPCLGGTNRTLTSQPDAACRRTFIKTPEGHNAEPLETETYLIDRHPELGSYWRHESLKTPEAVGAAYTEYVEWRRKHDAERALSLFSGAAADRAFRLRMDPLNLEAASALLPVMRGERRSNQWREMDRTGWHYALGKLNAWPQRHAHNRLKRADTVKVDGCELAAWYDWRAFKAAEGSSEIDHAVLVAFTWEQRAYWWGNEHAMLDLLEPVAVA